MAKTTAALAPDRALDEGVIHSFDDGAATYAPELKGSLYGETRIVTLLCMASGAQTQVLGLVQLSATGKTLYNYVAEKIWQPLGAEAKATWQLNPVDQLEVAQAALMPLCGTTPRSAG